MLNPCHEVNKLFYIMGINNWCLPLHLELFPEVKIAVSCERLGRALPATLNISINYFRPVSVNVLFHQISSQAQSVSYESLPKKKKSNCFSRE